MVQLRSKQISDLAGGGSQLARFTANDALFPSSSPAAFTSRNQHAVLAFDDGGIVASENILFEETISTDYSDGSLTVDIHWVAATATAGAVKWNVQFEATSGLDIDADSFNTAQTGTSTTNGTSGTPTVTSITFTQAQADAIASTGSFRIKLTRDTPDAGDTMVGDAQVFRVLVRQ